MNTIYKPTVAKDEFAGHTFEEIHFAQNLKNSVDGFFRILSGEEKGRNAKEAMLELMEEVKETQVNE